MLIEDSKKYHLDFNVYATERNMEIEEYLIVMGGKVAKKEKRNFYDFYFEAINPELGG